MAGAVTAATLTTVAVFFPIVFVQGVAGQLFRDQAVTVCLSLADLTDRLADLDPCTFGLHRPHRLRDRGRASPADEGARRRRAALHPSALPGSSSNRSATGVR